MKTDLCWFGYVSQLRPLRIAVEFDLAREVRTFRDAPEGLEDISNNEYALILFNAPTPVGKLELPEGVYLKDWLLTDCYVISCAREKRPKTPIIVTHINYFERYDPSAAIKMYLEAGATDSIDWTHSAKHRPFRPFIDLLRKHL